MSPRNVRFVSRSLSCVFAFQHARRACTAHRFERVCKAFPTYSAIIWGEFPKGAGRAVGGWLHGNEGKILFPSTLLIFSALVFWVLENFKFFFKTFFVLFFGLALGNFLGVFFGTMLEIVAFCSGQTRGFWFLSRILALLASFPAWFLWGTFAVDLFITVSYEWFNF